MSNLRSRYRVSVAMLASFLSLAWISCLVLPVRLRNGGSRPESWSDRGGVVWGQVLLGMPSFSENDDFCVTEVFWAAEPAEALAVFLPEPATCDDIRYVSRLKRVVSLTASGESINADAVMSLLTANNDIRYIRLYDIPAAEMALELLGKHTQVRRVALSMSRFNPESLTHLAGLPSLVLLDVSSCDLSQVDLTCGFTSLEWLNLYFNPLQRVAISDLPRLRELDVSASDLESVTVVRCGGLDSLRLATDSLRGMQIEIDELPELATAQIYGKVDAASRIRRTNCGRLTRVELKFTEVAASLIGQLRGPNVRRIAVELGGESAVRVVESVALCPNVAAVEIGDGVLEGPEVRALSHHSSIRELDLSGVRVVADWPEFCNGSSAGMHLVLSAADF